MTSAHDKDGTPGGYRLVIWATTGALMLAPLLLIRGADEPAWRAPGDFIFLAVLLAGVGIAYEAAARVPDDKAYWAGLVVALASTVLQTWINLAVGVIGSEDNPINWVYAGVTAVAVAGVALSRFHAESMAYAMVASAIAQGIAFVIALVVGRIFTGPITVFFTALWLLSAWLFRKAAQD